MTDLRLPGHLATNPSRLRALQCAANSASALYGVPVYLCGSALREDHPEPRDWDFRLCLPDEVFALRYGGGSPRAVERWIAEGATGCYSAVRWHWSDDCVKQSRHASRRTGLCVDLQVYPETHWRKQYADAPRVRIDTRDDPDAPQVLLAGEG